MIDLKEIPKNPGCYLFKDSKGKVIYVGKAKDLSKRVRSYFQKGRSADPKLRSEGAHEVERLNVLVSNIDSVDFVIVDNEVEALILENNLIKKYRPRYNIDLKDSKRYAYVEITNEKFPRLLLARSRAVSGGGKRGKFYGPFISGLGRDHVLRVLRNTFKIRTCRKLPKKRCMRYEIGLCTAPCEGLISREDYLADVKNAEMVLKGKTKGVVEILNKKMRRLSGDKEFEKAIVVRDQIRAVKDLEGKQKMERGKKFDEDFVNWIVRGEKVHLILFNARKGILENKQSFEFDWSPDFLEEFLVQFYSDYDCPREVVLPESVGESVVQFIKDKGGEVVVPKVGEKKKLLELVKKNIEVTMFGGENKVRDLGEKLGLNFLPRVIECFDVSHLSGTDVVASMVQFRDGKPQKSEYRKFKIKGLLAELGDAGKVLDKSRKGSASLEGLSFAGDLVKDYIGNDDYYAMKEVLTRRYSRLARQRLAGDRLQDKKTEMPDLIVVDGGKGQLGVAVEVLRELGLKIAVIGIAKREEEVILPKRQEDGWWKMEGGRILELSKKSDALKLLQEIRDEAHRFAISYQRLLRSRRLKEA